MRVKGSDTQLTGQGSRKDSFDCDLCGDVIVWCLDESRRASSRFASIQRKRGRNKKKIEEEEETPHKLREVLGLFTVVCGELATLAAHESVTIDVTVIEDTFLGPPGRPQRVPLLQDGID